MGSIHPSVPVLPIKQEPASCPPVGKSIPKAGRRWAVGPPGERSPSRAEISGATCITHRAAPRSWGSQASTGEENIQARTYLQVYRPPGRRWQLLCCPWGWRSTRWAPGCHGDGGLEPPALVETQFPHRTSTTAVAHGKATLSTSKDCGEAAAQVQPTISWLHIRGKQFLHPLKRNTPRGGKGAISRS